MGGVRAQLPARVVRSHLRQGDGRVLELRLRASSTIADVVRAAVAAM